MIKIKQNSKGNQSKTMENFKRKSIASFFIMLFVICTFSPMMAVAAALPPDNFTLTTHTIGNGTITIDSNLTEFVNGTVVNLTAVPDYRWQFVNWSGDIIGTVNSTTITMDANKTVTATFEFIILPISITIAPDTATLNVTETRQFTATVSPIGANQSVTWSVDNETIGTIDATTGFFTTSSVGTVNVTATSDADINVHGNATVTVIEPIVVPEPTPEPTPPTSINITPDTATLNVTETRQFTATVSPIGANQNVTWSVDNITVGTINATGYFTANAIGTVNVTATSDVDGNITGNATVTVEPQPAPSSITITPDTPTLNVNRTLQFTATVSPIGANQSVTWSVDNETIGTIDATTGFFTALATGNITITATSVVDGNITWTINATVGEVLPPPKVAMFFDNVAKIARFMDIPREDMPVNLSVYDSRRDAIAGYIAEGLNLTDYQFILIDTHGSGAGAISRLYAMNAFIEPARNDSAQIALLDFTLKTWPATVCPVNHPNISLYFENVVIHGNALNLLNYIYVNFLNGTAEVHPPEVMPLPGIYHPDAPGFFFCNTADYIAWAINRTNNPFDPAKPTIGILGSRSQIAAGDLALSNALIRQIEASGANVILAYPDNIRPIEPDLPLFYYNDTLLIDAAITLQTHIAGVPHPVRRDQFIDMGVPILGATVTGMTPCEWKNCTRGIPLGQMWRIVPREIKGVFACTVVAGQDEDEFGGRIHVPLPAQIERLVNRTINHANLGRMESSEKNIAIIYYNHPPGRHGIGASGLNVPRSLERLLTEMNNAGFNVNLMNETEILAAMQKHGINIGQFAQPVLEQMVDNHRNDIIMIPVAEYQRWFTEMIPPHRQREVIEFWGEIPGNSMVVQRNGIDYFVIPAIRNENVWIMPQPTRGGGSLDEAVVFHNLSIPPHHQYIAFYLWLQQPEQSIDAIIHFGTHGTQEWLPGKERGLAVDCWPFLMSGEIPIIYPYIVDNVGEATQAKRRGDAVIISHMIPQLVAAGLHGDLLTLHEWVHDYHELEPGSLKDAHRNKTIEMALNMNFDRDMGTIGFEGIPWDSALIDKIHIHIHQVEADIIPFGLHVLGDDPKIKYLPEAVMMIIGPYFIPEIIMVGGITGAHECEVEDEALSKAHELLILVAINQTDPIDAQMRVLGNSSETLTGFLNEGKTHFKNFLSNTEMESILNALSGGFIPPSMGGDPIRSPDSLPTGRNLYSFDPRTVPTRAAWEVGRDTMRAFLADYHSRHGEYPDRISSILWVVETMRHQGVAEAQILYAMGVEPVWDRRERVRIDGPRGAARGLSIISDVELYRPRIDVTVIISGLYRDVFSCRIEVIDAAVRLVANHEEAGQINHIRRNYLALRTELIEDGISEEKASMLASARIFGPAPGAIGPRLDDAIKASGTWDTKDSLIELYLNRMGHIHSSELWGVNHRDIFERALRGTDVAMLSRSSAYFGVLNTDGPFEWLGGLSMVIEHLDGAPPELVISDLRNPHKSEIVTLSEFIRRELRARYYNPRWIEGQMGHGYSGAREMSKAMTNLWGFQVTTPHLITDDMWEEMFEVFIQDKHGMGLNQFFDEHNPWALQTSTRRMLETIERGWWDADSATINELAERFIKSVAEHGLSCCAVCCANPRIDKFIAEQIEAGNLNIDRDTARRFDEQMESALGRSINLAGLLPAPEPIRLPGVGVGVEGLIEPAPAEPAPAEPAPAEPAPDAAVVGAVIEPVAPMSLADRLPLPVTQIAIGIVLIGVMGAAYMFFKKD